MNIEEELEEKKYKVDKDAVRSVYIVLVKNIKKFEKYSKLNRVRNKNVINIKAILKEEDVTADNYYFKILIMKRIQESVDKKRDVFYIPDFDSPTLNIKGLAYTLRKTAREYTLNLLMFHDDFIGEEANKQAIAMLEEFEATQILQDY